MSDPLSRPFGQHSFPDPPRGPGADRPPDGDGREPRPGPRRFTEEPLGFWLRRALMAAPCLFGAVGGLISGLAAIVFALIAVVSGRAPGPFGGSPATIRTLLLIGVLSIVPAVLLSWEAMLVLSKRTRVRPWLCLLVFGVVATALWTALLIVAWPGFGVALVGVIFPYTLVLAILALWRGQPDGVRLKS
jgi:hypothetical protein